MRRKTKAPIDDSPVPWEDRPISRERWQKHCDLLMSSAGAGRRPEEWWLYEKGRKQPKNQTQVLYTMGELRGAELARLMEWWRDAFTVGHFGTIRKTPEQRQAYLDFHNVPHELVAQWDAGKVKGVA